MTNKTMAKNIIYINNERDFKRFNRLNEANEFIDEVADEFNDFDDAEKDPLNEADGEGSNEKPDEPMDEEKLRIESVKLATNMAKLMDNVSPDDIIKLAGMVAEFIRNNRNGDISSNENPFEDTSADEPEFDEDMNDFEDETNNEE